MASTDSSRRLIRLPNGTPTAMNWARVFGFGKPPPIPAISRPSDSRSSVASWCASRIGWRSAGSSTAVPSATRSVASATAASNSSRSARGLVTGLSPAHTESNPSRSARRACATSRPGSCSPRTAWSRVGNK